MGDKNEKNRKQFLPAINDGVSLLSPMNTAIRILRYPLFLIISIIAFTYGCLIDSFALVPLSMIIMCLLSVDVLPARIIELCSYRKFRKTKGFLLAKELFLANINDAGLEKSYGYKRLSFTIYDDENAKIIEINFQKRTAFLFSKMNEFEINGVSVFVPLVFERELVTTAEKKLKELRNELKRKYGGSCDEEVVKFEEEMRETETKLEINHWDKF